MANPTRLLTGLCKLACLVLIAGCQLTSPLASVAGVPDLNIHYIEIVAENVDSQCRALERLHGLSFGPVDEDLGYARVAETADGVMIGVRAPLAEHELPIVRTYYEVDDIVSAVESASASGAEIAYGPVVEGETGTWAIYILDGIQYGLWQR